MLATCDYGGEFVAAVQKDEVCACQFHPEKSGARGVGIFKNFLEGDVKETEDAVAESAPPVGVDVGLARRVIACLDVRSNDTGDLVVTKGDSYDVREKDEGGDVRNLGKPVELAGKYYEQGADEVAFLNITGYRDLPLTDAPMLEVLDGLETVFVPLTVGGGIRDFTDSNGKAYTALEVGFGVLLERRRQSLHRLGRGVRRGGVLRERRREGRKHVRGTDLVSVRRAGGGHLRRPAARVRGGPRLD